MNIKNALLVVFILGMVGGAMYLSYNQRLLPDIAQVDKQTAEMMLRLQEDNAQVNEAVLRARDNIDANYDKLTKATAVLQETVDDAYKLAQYSGNAQALSAAGALRHDVTQKLDSVEHFKSHNSVLRNSLRYAPQVGETLAKIAQSHSLDALAMTYLNTASNLQFYNLVQDPQNKKNLLNTLNTLVEREKAMPDDSVAQQIEFSSHGRTILMEAPVVSELINEVLHPLDQPFAKLNNGFLAWQKYAQKVVDRQNQFFMAYIIYLVIGLLFIMWWLVQLYRTLDKRIAERTEELKKTYDELTHSQMLLMQSEKMATLGQMVAGVAHEVNTPLGYVKGNVDLISDLVAQYGELLRPTLKFYQLQQAGSAHKEEKLALLKTIVQEARQIDEDGLEEECTQLFQDTRFGLEQINELIVNLRNFARLDEAKVKQVKISECIESSLNIARNNVKHLQIEKRYQGKRLPEIECSPSQINQVLLNLFNNAAQAMDKSDGRLVIDVEPEEGFLNIRIGDNGSGMKTEVQKKIFEPFFTTKGSGEGTGLGLAICKQIIESHGGTIDVRSKLGKGSVFTIRLPITPASQGKSENAKRNRKS